MHVIIPTATKIKPKQKTSAMRWADALLPLALGEEHVVSRFPDDGER